MKVSDMESRMEFLRGELERELRLSGRQLPPEVATNEFLRQGRLADVGKLLLELGALEMRLMEADRR